MPSFFIILHELRNPKIDNTPLAFAVVENFVQQNKDELVNFITQKLLKYKKSAGFTDSLVTIKQLLCFLNRTQLLYKSLFKVLKR